MAGKLNNQMFLLSPTVANLVAPFSSAQDLTRFQSASSLVQLFFATMKGFRPVNVKSRGWRGFPKEELTHPAEEVCARADLRLLAVVVVRHDHLEPLGRQLVAPLSCPGQDFWGLVVFWSSGHLTICLFVCLPPSAIESLNVVIPDHSVRSLSHCVDIEVWAKVDDLCRSFYDHFPICFPFRTCPCCS